jgi:hypothetical protein
MTSIPYPVGSAQAPIVPPPSRTPRVWLPVSWVVARPHGPNPMVIDPARMRQGHRVGYLTLRSRPVLQSNGSWIAECRCDCGWIVKRDVLKHFSCGCHKSMPPDHPVASRWDMNRGAYLQGR